MIIPPTSCLVTQAQPVSVNIVTNLLRPMPEYLALQSPDVITWRDVVITCLNAPYNR